MDNSAEYFESYEELDIHRLMLSDNPRMKAYKNAIFQNKNLFRDKIVMDIGAGTGILSVFCAQAGAARVYAIEAASELSKLALKVVEENNMKSIITVINAKLEDIPLESVEKVDIIVSEWMGFYLVHEGMLDTVIEARYRFLKPNGHIFPTIARIYAAPCEIPEFFDFWDNVHGVKMKCIGNEVRRAKSTKPEVMLIKSENLLAEEKMIAWMDLASATIDDLRVIGGQDLVFPAGKKGKVGGLCVWFDVEFPNSITLSTSPEDLPTHWKQTVIVLPEEHEIDEELEPLAFRVTIKRDEVKKRWYNLQVEVLDPETTEHDLPCDCIMTKCIVAKEYIKNHCQEIDLNVNDEDDM